MLTSYIDESGHARDAKCRFVGLAGLTAPAEKWGHFVENWQSVLDEFIQGKTFHMKDFVRVPGKGVYEGWKESRRREFLARLLEAIKDCECVPTGCVVSLDAFELLDPLHQKFFENPYYMAFQQVTRGASLEAIPKQVPFEPERVDMVYAYQSEYGAIPSTGGNLQEAGKAQKLRHAMKDLTHFGQWMGTYASAFPRDMLPLQAADLFAYELTQEFENRLARPKDKMRWALRQLLSGSEQPLIKIFSFEVMIETLVENEIIKPPKDLESVLSIAASMNKIEMRDLLRKRSTYRT